jgi:hypothetical protein
MHCDWHFAWHVSKHCKHAADGLGGGESWMKPSMPFGQLGPVMFAP